MGTYIKVFDTHADYLAFTQTEDFILPNVSYCEDEIDVVHYSPLLPPTNTNLVAKYNIMTAGVILTLFKSNDGSGSGSDESVCPFSAMTIDGVEQPTVVSTYEFSTTGEHIVEYTLTDPTTIAEHVFENCDGLTSIVIPSGVTSIGQLAFYNCVGLTSITLGSGVTSIGGNAFASCTSLTSVTIPNSVTSIGEAAFGGCSGLTSITIPSGVTSIGKYAFHLCSSLTTVTVRATTPPTLDRDAFDYANIYTIYVPSASVNTYKSAPNWANYSQKFQAIS